MSTRRSNRFLLERVYALSPQLVAAAQTQYDAWNQDQDGFDEELGCGGLCQNIAEDFCSILGEAGFAAEMVDNNGVGEQHVWAEFEEQGWRIAIDIPPGIYESGGGFCWKKRPGVKFCRNHLCIFTLN